MEKADGRQIGLDGGGGLIPFLHIEHVGGEVLATDVGQFLQAIVVRQEPAKPFHGLIVSLLGAETALTVVPGGLVQLDN